MTVVGIKDLFQTLNNAGVRYLVAGGLAVTAHGFVRLTVDTDLFIDLQDDNLRKALDALSKLGYRPRVPVDLFDFTDVHRRRLWIEEKGMVVFQLISDRYPSNPVDIFADAPFDFATEYGKAVPMEVEPGLQIPVVAIETLITMKRTAGRTKDLLDIEYLQRVLKERDEEKT